MYQNIILKKKVNWFCKKGRLKHCQWYIFPKYIAWDKLWIDKVSLEKYYNNSSDKNINLNKCGWCPDKVDIFS